MESAEGFSVLFTQNLRGDLHFLPKLARVLWQKRLENKRTLTVDLGGTCAPDVWHCEATEGRSMLIALEGLNYAAVNVDGLPEHSRVALSRSVTLMRLVDDAHPAKIPSARFLSRRPLEQPDVLTIVMTPAAEARVDGLVVELPSIAPYKIGKLHFRTTGVPQILGLETFDVPPDTRPDATITGMVEFIESEARLYQKRRSKNDNPSLD